jgi:type IV pilus assembly protein PilY1
MEKKLTKNLCLLGILIPYLILMTASQSWGSLSGTLDYRVESVEDDAEQVGVSTVTDIYDLELGDKLCGIRFRQVKIPKGSTITRAYIQFTVDEARLDVTNLTIWGESKDIAKQFENIDNNISSRNKTSVSVAWNDVPVWGNVFETGVAQQTPDISTIVQEVIDLPTWKYDDPVLFIIEGSGERVGKAYKSGADVAPLLHIEYVSSAIEVQVSDANDDVEEKADGNMFLTSPDLDFYNSTDRGVGIRFQKVAIPPGAVISKAYIEFVAHNEGAATLSDPASFVINGEASGDAPAFTSTANNLSTRTATNQAITWNPLPAWDLEQKYQTPDLSAIVQEIVGRADWLSGNDMTFIGTHGFGWRCS